MKPRILLVDAERAILLTFKIILEMNGFGVDTASSVPEGVQKIKNGAFDVIIADARTVGFDVITAARQQSYNPATAILTAYPYPEAVWKSSGAQKLFVKPVTAADLLRGIEELLNMQKER